MKIFVIDRPWDDCGAPDGAPVLMLPDTSLTPKGMPVFLPDFCREGWELRSVTAYRIGRLGKSIGARFAERYIDGVTLGALLKPAGSLPCGSVLEYGFDSSLTLGDFRAVAEGYACEWGGESFEAGPERDGVARAIELLSRRCTLRTGDILIPRLGKALVAAAIGARVDMSLGGAALRAVRVK